MRINLHWGISNLLVLTIIEAMLRTTQFALAAAHKPSLSDVLCNDSVTPCVQPPPCDIHCRLSYRAHVTACCRRSCWRGRSLVGGRIVQNNDHLAPQVAQQLAEKHANFFLPDIVEVKLIVQTQALAARAGLTEIPEMTETLSRRR
jgi:hypothetical protein